MFCDLITVWHGTDKESSEAIAHDDFRISWATKQHHGQRFGSGVYFSDSLDKSLTYTTPDKEGIRYVIPRLVGPLSVSLTLSSHSLTITDV